MDVNRLPIHHHSTGDRLTVHRARSIACVSGQRSVVGHASDLMTVITINQSILCLAYARGVLGHGIENRLEVGRRAGDDAQNFARRSLLRERLSKVMVSCIYLSKQLAILKRPRRLVNENLDQSYLFIGKREYFRSAHQNHAHGDPFMQQRHGQ